jgi:hypothetical protein
MSLDEANTDDRPAAPEATPEVEPTTTTAEGAETAASEPEIEVETETRVAPTSEAEARRRTSASAAKSMVAELAERTVRLAAAERAAREAVRDRELTAALAELPLVRGGVGQLVKLLRDEVETTAEGRVRARDGRSVAAAVADWLARPEYAHFRMPASRGGSAVPGGTSRAASIRGGEEAAAAEPRNLGEAAILRWRAAASGSSGPEAPIGLHRRRGR